eukprot:3441853-Rhodomonas_salina.5
MGGGARSLNVSGIHPHSCHTLSQYRAQLPNTFSVPGIHCLSTGHTLSQYQALRSARVDTQHGPACYLGTGDRIASAGSEEKSLCYMSTRHRTAGS